MKKIRLIVFLFLLIFSAACSSLPGDRAATSKPQSSQTSGVPLKTTLPASLTFTPIPTSTPSPEATVSHTPTPTPSPTSTLMPPPTATPFGGASGIIRVDECTDVQGYRPIDCTSWLFSISSSQVEVISSEQRPELRSIEENEFDHRLELYNPTSGESQAILTCPQEYQQCSQQIISGSTNEEWIYVIQGQQVQLYDGKYWTELYRVNPLTGESSFIDRFDNHFFDFIQFPGSSRGLMSLFGQTTELLIYNLETQERQTIVKQNSGQFYHFGFSPDRSKFWYRIADECGTELVSSEGKRIARLKNSDGVLGWLDQDRFLLFTAEDNPPVCTSTGIAVANQYGLIGEWIAQSAVSSFDALLSPDATRLVFASGCNNNGCREIRVADSDGSHSYPLSDSPEEGSGFQFKFSPDGSLFFYVVDNRLMMAKLDGSDPQLVFEPGEGFIAGYSFYTPSDH